MSAADSVIAYGMSEIGKPYVYGDEGPNAFDCSGLMQFIFGKAGLELPRTAREQQDFATPVSEPRPGDLVFWNDPATHVGLYLGGGRVLNAPNSQSRVRIDRVWGDPTYGRVLNGPAATIKQVALPGLPSWQEIGQGARTVGVILAVVVGGVALIGVGAWQTVKGA